MRAKPRSRFPLRQESQVLGTEAPGKPGRGAIFQESKCSVKIFFRRPIAPALEESDRPV
jgi:hypothetical protein